jgi:hypothetical protein
VDNSLSAPTSSFGPSRPVGWLIAAAALLTAVTAVVTGDPEGRVLLILATILLAGIACSDLLFNPRIRADRDGLTIRTPSTRTHLGWDEIDTVRVEETSRFGLANRTLELEADALLVVLSRRALGADPRDVLTLLEAYRPPA